MRHTATIGLGGTMMGVCDLYDWTKKKDTLRTLKVYYYLDRLLVDWMCDCFWLFWFNHKVQNKFTYKKKKLHSNFKVSLSLPLPPLTHSPLKRLVQIFNRLSYLPLRLYFRIIDEFNAPNLLSERLEGETLLSGLRKPIFKVYNSI